jgi:tetratricopeptide (TPR) repeat protein
MINANNNYPVARRNPLPIIFLHQMKAAGNTLREILKREYGEDQLHVYHSTPTAFQDIPPGIKVIAGHIQFHFHRNFPTPATWITTLREPVDRIISDFNYILTTSEHHFHQYAKTRNIVKFITDGLYLWADNAQVKFLSGEMDVRFGRYKPGLLEQARSNMGNHFKVVGTSERFDETLILMKRTFGWQTPYYTRENVSRNKLRKEDFSSETLKQLERFHRLDQELYRYACDLLEEQITLQDASFHQEVEVFKLLNQHCAPYIGKLADAEAFEKHETLITQDAVYSLTRDQHYTDALKVLDYMLTKYPDSRDLQSLKARVKYEMGTVEEAERMYMELMARWPEHPGAYCHYGAILWEHGKRDSAMQHFTKALRIDYLHRETILHCGKALIEFNRTEEAKALFLIYLKEHPEDGEIEWMKNNLLTGDDPVAALASFPA